MWWIAPLIGGIWDAITGEIPDHLTVPAAVLSFLYFLLFSPQRIVEMVLFGVVGYLLYRYGQVGGGDVLLILAVSPFIAPHFFPFSLLGVFLLSLTLSTAFYGFFYNRKWAVLLPFLPPIGWILLGTLLMATVDRNRFVKEVPVKELQKEDVLAEPVEGFPKMVIEEGDVERLKKMGVEKVKILVDLPRMGPFIFLGVLLWNYFQEIPFSLLVQVPLLLFL